MEDVGIFYGNLVYFTAIWYILCPFGISYGYLVFFPVLVCCTKKNLATLVRTYMHCRPKVAMSRRLVEKKILFVVEKTCHRQKPDLKKTRS
jgi:hypothetical protein